MNRQAPSERIVLTVSLLCAAMLAGCQSTPIRDPEFAPVMPLAEETVTERSDGAIFRIRDERPVAVNGALFMDMRARSVGDLLTIKLVEKTDAKKSTSTTVEQDTTYDINNPTLFGATPSVKPPFSGLVSKVLPSTGRRYDMQADLSSAKDFEGTGDSTQSNSISGEISVTVAKVLPNGNLVVQGEKLMTLNRGHEHLRLSGIVRPVDISEDNSVLSTRVANARIVYSGEGEVADASRIHWLGRFFLSVLWPL